MMQERTNAVEITPVVELTELDLEAVAGGKPNKKDHDHGGHGGRGGRGGRGGNGGQGGKGGR